MLAERPRTVLQYSTTEGDPALRAAVAARLTGRGLATDADDLVVTGGSQQGLALLATVLLEPGDVVLVESPTYLAALQCFGFAGARVVPVPTDEDGVLPDALEELVLRERPKLLYLIPDFQNPTGRTLPAERRRAVAEVAGFYTGCGSPRTTRTGSCASKATGCRGSAPTRPPRTVRRCWAASRR